MARNSAHRNEEDDYNNDNDNRSSRNMGGNRSFENRERDSEGRFMSDDNSNGNRGGRNMGGRNSP